MEQMLEENKQHLSQALFTKSKNKILLKSKIKKTIIPIKAPEIIVEKRIREENQQK